MFDDIVPQNTNEPEDIFAGAPEPEPAAPLDLKSALANKKLKPIGEEGSPVAGVGSMPSGMKAMPQIEITPPLLSKKSVFVVIGIILIIGLGAGTVWGIFKASQKEEPKNTITNTVPVNVPVVATPIVTSTVEVVIPEFSVTTTPAVGVVPPDTDGDGLSDEEEVKYGTDYLKIDTDGDGLSDYEEIMIWKTDPLIADTDGDSYNDGVEVKNGFNPLGSGKLLELPVQ